MSESILRTGRTPTEIAVFLLRVVIPPAALLIAVLLALLFGSVSIPPMDIVQVLVYKLHPSSVHPTWPPGTLQIVWYLRLPDVVAAGLVGLALALAGTLFQAVLRNPLADPYVIGTSAGAQLGVTIAFVAPFQFSLLGFGPLQIAAFIGALGTVLFVYALARSGSGTPVVTLILAGFVVSSFLISATTLLTFLGADANARLVHLLTWTLGGLDIESWGQIGIAAPCILLGGVLTYFLAPQLNLILLGEEQAAHLGVRVERLKLGTIVLASFLTALAVTLGGVIAFVGLVVPHAVRLLYGPGHRALLPVSAMLGAAFVVLCDLVARVAVAPTTLPLGVVTAVIGAPFFLHLLHRGRREYSF